MTPPVQRPDPVRRSDPAGGDPVGGDPVAVDPAGGQPVAVEPAEGSPRITLRAVGAVLLALVLVAVMVRLSVWQWDRGRARGSLLNYSYGVEWMLFAVLTLGGLVRLGREGRRMAQAPRPEVRVGGPQIGPPLGAGEELPDVTWLRLRRRLGLDRAAVDRET